MTLGRGIATNVIRKLPLKEAKGQLNCVCVVSWDRRDCDWWPRTAGTLNVDRVGELHADLGLDTQWAHKCV